MLLPNTCTSVCDRLVLIPPQILSNANKFVSFYSIAMLYFLSNNDIDLVTILKISFNQLLLETCAKSTRVYFLL